MGHIRFLRRTQHFPDLAGSLLLLPRNQGQVPGRGKFTFPQINSNTDLVARRHVRLRSLQP
jgi:hypothetical protein